MHATLKVGVNNIYTTFLYKAQKQKQENGTYKIKIY